ncbi:MAG: hypothetical protein ACKVWR_03845, partial [Acidimicrobiales bacterium]
PAPELPPEPVVEPTSRSLRLALTGFAADAAAALGVGLLVVGAGLAAVSRWPRRARATVPASVPAPAPVLSRRKSGR